MQNLELDPGGYRRKIADLIAAPCTDEKFNRLVKLVNGPEMYSSQALSSGTAVMGLVNCGERALPVIRPLLDRPQSQLAAFAINALVDLRDDASYARIFQYLDPYYSWAQESALYAVLRLNAFEQVENVVRLLVHYATPVHDAAWDVLLGLTGLTGLGDAPVESELHESPRACAARIRALEVWPEILIESFERAKSGIALGLTWKTDEPVPKDFRQRWRTDTWFICDKLVTFALGCLSKGDAISEATASETYRALLLEMKKDLATTPRPKLLGERSPHDILQQMTDLVKAVER